jgi:hypothetical protein
MDAGEKVSLLRDMFCEGSNLKFAKLMNSSPTTVSNWCKADSLGKEVLIKILAKLPEVDANWLLMDTGSVLKEDLPKAEASLEINRLAAEVKALKEELKESYKETGRLEGENNLLREQMHLGEKKKDRSA